MNKTTKIVLGSAAAIGLIGGGTALAVANNNSNSASASASASASSSIRLVEPGTQSGGQALGGQPPQDGQGTSGKQSMRGGGPIADVLAEALGLDADTVAAAVAEVETELGTQGPPDFQSSDFIEALATKLGLTADQVSEALSSMTPPGNMGRQAQKGTAPDSSSTASPSASSSEGTA